MIFSVFSLFSFSKFEVSADSTICEGNFQPLEYEWLSDGTSAKRVALCGEYEESVNTFHHILIEALKGCHWLLDFYNGEWNDRSIKVRPFILDESYRRIICTEDVSSVLVTCRKGEPILFKDVVPSNEGVHRVYEASYKGELAGVITPAMELIQRGATGPLNQLHSISIDVFISDDHDVTPWIYSEGIRFFNSAFNKLMCPSIFNTRDYCTEREYNILKLTGPFINLSSPARGKWQRLDHKNEKTVFGETIEYHMWAPSYLEEVYRKEGLSGALKFLESI